MSNEGMAIERADVIKTASGKGYEIINPLSMGTALIEVAKDMMKSGGYWEMTNFPEPINLNDYVRQALPIYFTNKAGDIQIIYEASR